MLFTSYNFVLLVIGTMLLFYTPCLRKLQSIILIASSFLFYTYAQPVLLSVLIISIILNIFSSLVIVSGRGKYRLPVAAGGVAANIGLLAFFKYSPLFGETFLYDTGPIGNFLLTIPLPLGISFFTFQGVTLLVDTLRSKEKTGTSILDRNSFFENVIVVTHYISFFPKLVAGPIINSRDFIPQIKSKFFKDIDWDYCFRALTMGYFLKMVIADNLKDQTVWIQYPYFMAKSTYMLLAMVFSYSIQIFSDFAGYSLIAIGIAGLFGYTLPKNFNFPYISKSFSEFWTRWHISLSQFLKEYLYFPLGGNRKGKIRTYLNLMIVMLLGGFWHGAAWSYLVWGGLHGFALVVERFFSQRISIADNVTNRCLRIIGVFTFVSFAWLLFKLPDFSHVTAFMTALFNNTQKEIKSDDFTQLLAMFFYCLPVFLYHLQYLFRTEFVQESRLKLMPIAYGGMLFFILTNSGTTSSFIYFQF